MGWTFEHSADTPARAADIWSRYADVENWFAWSPAVEWSRLDGAFEVGSTGESKAPGVDAMSFRIIRVELESVFATETELPGATLLFEHIIEKRGDGSRITHRAVLSGPSADAYVPVVQPLVEKNLPEGVTRLAGLAVSTSSA